MVAGTAVFAGGKFVTAGEVGRVVRARIMRAWNFARLGEGCGPRVGLACFGTGAEETPAPVTCVVTAPRLSYPVTAAWRQAGSKSRKLESLARLSFWKTALVLFIM